MLMVCAANNLARRRSPYMVRRADLPLGQVEGRWWLLHTKPRQEKALAWDLYDRGLDYFLPLIRTTRRYGRRSTSVELPLFTGYLFASCASEHERYQALATQRVANLIEILDQSQFIRELDHVYLAVKSPRKVRLYPGLKRGRRCRVVSGSLKGVEGVVIRRAGAARVFIDVTLLGQSAVVDVDITRVEAID